MRVREGQRGVDRRDGGSRREAAIGWSSRH
jgi:hypothetical protein